MKKFNLELEEGQVRFVLEALAEVPFKFSAPVINEIQNQWQAQIEASKTEEAEK